MTSLWTNIREIERRSKCGHKYVLACCGSCGKDYEVLLKHIKSGRSNGCKTCGNSQKNKKHGLSGHKYFSTWDNMMQRCYNDKRPEYLNYGGRGIDVYKPFHDANTFIKWITSALGERPEGHTLDRIDNDRGYHPDNLRWADRKTQQSNRRISSGS